MNKDVIYIDVEDDVTAIIGKIKASKEKIIALVPPKRVGVLQSAVNLRLLDRMAHTSHKRLVLITNNQALIALSAAAGIPVAKNLQSKPELAEITALSVDDDEDIIDGSSLPVGELEKTSDKPKSDPVDDAIDTLDIDDKNVDVSTGMGAVAIKKTVKKRTGVKVPNFSSFRKKLFLGITAGVVFILFLVWANIFAPSATVVITARTTDANVSQTVTLAAGTAPTNLVEGTIQSSTQQLKKDVSVDFDATGSKDVGERASGSVTVRNCDSSEPFVIDAGTVFTASSGQDYTSNSQATVPGLTGSASVCRNTGTGAGVVTIAVTAINSGEASNIAATSYIIEGVGGDVYANGTAMSGGTTKLAKVVSELDIQKATDTLKQQKTDDVKKQLIEQFTNGEVVIDDSFTVDYGAPVSAPALNAEAPTGKAKLTSSVTYTITAIAKADLQLYIKENINKQLGDDEDQRIYDDGIDDVKLSNFVKTGDTATVKILGTGKVGPKIDEDVTKEQVKGKKAGEAQSIIGNIDGVDDVKVNYSFFWVTTIPNNLDKITIEFKLQDE
jgi:hypothetical protein